MGEKELLIIEFGMKLVLFRIGMGMFFQRKVKRWWLEVLGYMFFSCLCIWGRMSSMELEGILWLIIISLQFLTIRVSDVKQYGWIVVQIFVVCYIEEIGRMVVADVVNIDSTAEMQKWMDLAGNLLAIWILGILFCISLVVGDRSDFFYKEKYRRYMRNGIIGAVGFVAVEMIWCAVVLHYLPDLIPDTLLEKLPDLKLISLLAMAGIGVLIIFVAYIHHSNEKLEELLKENQSLRQKEVGYYEGRLKQDEETRVYRHNMDGQILWLRALVSQGDLQQIEKCLDELSGNLHWIRQQIYCTGNRVLDTVLHAYLFDLDDAVEVTVIGRCDCELFLSDMEWCSVCSNLIHNAVEYLNRCTAEGRFLKIRLETGRDNFEMEITNFVEEGTLSYGSDGKLCTTKADFKNHGIGLRSVERIVRINHGIFEYRVEGQTFFSTVLFNIKK